MDRNKTEKLRAAARAKASAGLDDSDIYVSDDAPLAVEDTDGTVTGYWVKVEVYVIAAEIQ